MNEETTESSEWRTFLSHPFSARALNFFTNAQIKTVGQLAAMSHQDLRRFRNVGWKTVVEIKMALANPTSPQAPATSPLADTNPLDVTSKKKEIEMLFEEQIKLEAELRRVKEKLLEARASIPHTPSVKPAVFARWLELRDHNAVAMEFCLTPSKVKSIVSEGYRQQLKSRSLNEVDIFCYWEETRSYQKVAQEFGIPESLVKNIVVRLNKQFNS
jgi:hypothetical protein